MTQSLKDQPNAAAEAKAAALRESRHEFVDRHDGLLQCRVCRGMEATLTTTCTGAPLTIEQQNDVYDLRADYRDGIWVRSPSRLSTRNILSIHSVAGGRS